MTVRDSSRGVRLDLLLGRKVVDAAGEVLGRLEEVIADVQVNERGSDHVVREFHVGKYAMLERAGGRLLGGALFRLLGRGRGYTAYAIPWAMMDLSNPERPRVTVTKGELERHGDRGRR